MDFAKIMAFLRQIAKTIKNFLINLIVVDGYDDVDKNYIWSTIFATIALITLIVIRIKGFSVGRVAFESVMLLFSLVFVGKAKDKSQDADTIVNYNKNN